MEGNTASLQSLLQFALPLGTNLVTGALTTVINWSVTVRAQPPAFPDIHGGELALLNMELLRAYDNRIKMADAIVSLAKAGVHAVAVTESIPQDSVRMAQELDVALLTLPENSSLAAIERSINTLIVNQATQLTQRAMEIQRQLSRMAAENRDLNNLLQIVARATAKPAILHDDVGVVMAQAFPNVSRRQSSSHNLTQTRSFHKFQDWLTNRQDHLPGKIISSPIGYTTPLAVEKRIAGYLSLITEPEDDLNEFDRMVMSYGSDVCAIEIAKNRAISAAVEQAKGDWIQMWLGGTSTDSNLFTSRAAQAGFDLNQEYLVTVFQSTTESRTVIPVESMTSLVRDDMSRRQINGATGQYVDVIVALYPIDESRTIARLRIIIEDIRQQLADRSPSGRMVAGISRPVVGLPALREAYREARNALNIAQSLGDHETTTFYGDLKIYQLLLALKEVDPQHLQTFYKESLHALVEYDERKQGDLLHTLTGFFEANGNLAKAASDLNVHRNTLVYRLEKISDLTGMDLDNAENRLILHLALRIRRILNSQSD